MFKIDATTRSTNTLLAMTTLFIAIMLAARPATANPIDHLTGRWTGWGAVTLESGKTEKVKCVATYFTIKAGTKFKQNLRCASTGYKIDSTAKFEVTGKHVTGRWSEVIHDNTGTMSGTMTTKGFSISITGNAFTASLKLITGACRQSLTIVPINYGVTRIAIGLRKC